MKRAKGKLPPRKIVVGTGEQYRTVTVKDQATLRSIDDIVNLIPARKTDQMTADEIERKVEKMTDALDRQLMSGTLSQKEYDIAMRELAQWAERQYGWNPRA
jgi:RNA-splicing ligase RtcB